MKQKAKVSLKAAESLYKQNLLDPAASRFYYSLFQAAVFRLEERGLVPSQLTSGATRWDHAMVRNQARMMRGRRDDRDLVNDALALRVTADYFAVPVDPAKLSQCIPHIQALVKELTT